MFENNFMVGFKPFTCIVWSARPQKCMRGRCAYYRPHNTAEFKSESACFKFSYDVI